MVMSAQVVGLTDSVGFFYTVAVGGGKLACKFVVIDLKTGCDKVDAVLVTPIFEPALHRCGDNNDFVTLTLMPCYLLHGFWSGDLIYFFKRILICQLSELFCIPPFEEVGDELFFGNMVRDKLAGVGHEHWSQFE